MLPALPGFSTGGGAVTDQSSTTSGSDSGALSFGGFGGVTFGTARNARTDPTVWVIGIAAAAVVLIFISMRRKRR